MSDNISKGIQKILQFSKEEVKRLKLSHVAPEQLLLGIIKDKDGQANKMLRSLGCDLKEMKNMIEDLSKTPKKNINLGYAQLTQSTEKVIRKAYEEAEKSNRKIANQIDLLLSITVLKSGIINLEI